MTLHSVDSQAALRRAAILLSTLGGETSRALLSNVAPLKRALLRRAMNELTDVDPMERQRAMREFLSTAAASTTAPPASALNAAVGRDHGQRDHGQRDLGPGTSTNGATTPLSFLGTVPDRVLLSAIEEEHPQTIALVLASLETQQAARLLPKLSEATRHAAMQRLARLEQLPPDALDSIGEHLKKLVADASSSPTAASGSRALQAIFQQLPDELRRNMTQSLGWPDDAYGGSRERQQPAQSEPVAEPSTTSWQTLRVAPDTWPAAASTDAQERGDAPRSNAPRGDGARGDAPASDAWHSGVDQLDPQFERCHPVDIRDALATLSGSQAMLAVCGLPARVADRVLATLPRRQARQIRQQLQALDSVTLKDIDRAKLELATVLGLTLPQDRLSSAPAESRLLSTAA